MKIKYFISSGVTTYKKPDNDRHIYLSMDVLEGEDWDTDVISDDDEDEDEDKKRDSGARRQEWREKKAPRLSWFSSWEKCWFINGRDGTPYYECRHPSQYLGQTEIAVLPETEWKSLNPKDGSLLVKGTIELPATDATPEKIWQMIITECKNKLSSVAKNLLKLDELALPTDTKLKAFIEFEKMADEFEKKDEAELKKRLRSSPWD